MTDTTKTIMLEMLLSKGEVEKTYAMLKNRSDRRLNEDLDSHLAGGIEDTSIREALDKAIGHLGLIELGIQMDVVTTPGGIVRDFLSIPAVQRYAFRFYPQLLPMLLYDRLIGKASIKQQLGNERNFEIFGQVLRLDAGLERPSLAYFLDIVDDYVNEDYSDIAEIIASLRKPGHVERYLSLQDVPKKELDRACVGVFEFLEWANYLKKVIDRVDSPEVASAIWHQFGYWMNLIGGQLYGVLAAALEGVRYPRNLPDALIYVEEVEFSELDSQLESLRQLTSSLYAAPLERWRQKHYFHPEPSELRHV